MRGAVGGGHGRRTILLECQLRHGQWLWRSVVRSRWWAIECERRAQCQSRQGTGSCRGDGDGLTLQRARLLPANPMTLDKVLARPLEPGNETKRDESTVAEATVVRHEREGVVSRG
jgi:hypothetical protein